MKRIFITALAVCIISGSLGQVAGLQLGKNNLLAEDFFVAQIDTKLPEQIKYENKNKDNNKDGEKDVDKDKEEINPFFVQLAVPDRSAERQINQIEKLLKVNRHVEAVRLIATLLESSDDFLIPPPFQPRNINGKNVSGTNPDERTTNTTLTKRLLEILRNLPDKAKETYNLQYKTQAEKLLENAIKQGSFETLQKVAKKYLPTESGITALFFIAMYKFELGDWESALLTFDKINYVAEQFNFKLDSFEPAFSLSTAACQIRLDRNIDAKNTLDKFLKKFPRPQILLGGKETWRPTNTDEIFTRIKESIANHEKNAVAVWLDNTGWLLNRGIPSQNPETSASSPLLETLWQTPNFNQNETVTLVQKLQSTVNASTETYIPALQPLIVGNHVITRSSNEITATNIYSGKRIWNHNDNNFKIQPIVFQLLQNSGLGGFFLNKQEQLSYGALRINIWHDRIANSMSSDGERIFYIEGHRQKFSGFNRAIQQPLRAGNKAIENPFAKPSNTLNARDAKTGNLLWQIGKFNYVQKSFDKIEAELKESNKQNPNILPNGIRKTTQANRLVPDNNNNDNKENAKNEKEKENEKEKNTEPLFSEEELIFSETQFLGAPLPLHGNLYCICESEGLLQLFVLSSSDGKLLSRVPIAQMTRQLEKDLLRGLYCLTPSASNGIVFCPTGGGMVVAVDAVSVSPIWCFSYEQTPAVDPNNNGMRVVAMGNGRFIGNIDLGVNMTNNDYVRQIFSQSGWQVSSIMIDGNRVLIAPPDVPSLYCVDLLTGKLLWQMTNLYRPNALYVACIYNKIAYIVTPVSVLALSMENGRRIWEQVLSSQTTSYPNEADRSIRVGRNVVQVRVGLRVLAPAQVNPVPTPEPKQEPKIEAYDNNDTPDKNKTVKRPKLVFPTPLKPTGIGVHNGELYYIPLSGGHIGIINLAKCSIKLVSSPDSLAQKDEQQETANENQTQNKIFDRGFPVPFGNLIGLRGKFLSQSPLQLVCFDQWLDLNERTNRLLAANPNDSRGLLQLGKIRQVENKMDEAIRLFRRSLEVESSDVAAFHLRQALMDAVKNDYKSWKNILPELESLALTPVEYGEVLLAQAQGAANNGNIDDFVSTFQKIFEVESECPVNIALDNKLTSQLHNAVGLLMERMQQKNNDDNWRQKIDIAAKNIYNNFRNDNFNFETPQNTTSANSFNKNIDADAQQAFSEYTDNPVSREARSWQTFIELFRTLPIADNAKELLREHYRKNNFYLAVEMFTDLPVNSVEKNSDKDKNKDVDNSKQGVPVLRADKIKDKDKDKDKDKSKKDENNNNVKVSLNSRLPKLSDVELMARQLESCGVLSDAYYYYKLIAELYGDAGKRIAADAFKRAGLKEYIRKSAKLQDWNRGHVTFDVDGIDGLMRRRERQAGAAAVPRNHQAYMILQLAGGNRNQNRQGLRVRFTGNDEPFLSQYSYTVEVRNNAAVLVAYNQSGGEVWQFDLSEHFHSASFFTSADYVADYSSVTRFQVLTRIVKGRDHLLIFTFGDKMIAIDTFGSGQGSNEPPRFLWARQLSSGCNFDEKRIADELFVNLAHRNHNNAGIPSMAGQHDISFCVTKNVICYRENNKIYGVNSLTGNTVWTREIHADSCSVFGDRDSLFLFYHSTRQVIAIEPFSGIELKHGVLAGNIMASYGVNVLVVNIDQAKKRQDVFVTDLRDIFLDTGNIKLCDFNKVVQNELCVVESGTLPVRVIFSSVSGGVIKLIKHTSDVRYVSFLIDYQRNIDGVLGVGGSGSVVKNLFVYDLQNTSYATGNVDRNGIFKGMELTGMFSGNEVTDFQIDCRGDKFMALLVGNTSVNRQATITEENGEKYSRNITPLVVSGSPYNYGLSESFMLFNGEGEQCWRESVNMNEWFFVRESLSGNVPVLLFAAVIRDQEINGAKNRMYLGINAIDKATGRKRARKLIPIVGNSNIQLVKLTTNQEENEIKLQCVDRTITIKFEEK
ncbi:MAG: PQQ-binding-like beta-propeller repeat protein [Planctomycetaceae bacterium]|nr:PQQ-binding-like beta-propeller repeat protein [Planctomycetaceae bacterium]